MSFVIKPRLQDIYEEQLLYGAPVPVPLSTRLLWYIKQFLATLNETAIKHVILNFVGPDQHTRVHIQIHGDSLHSKLDVTTNIPHLRRSVVVMRNVIAEALSNGQYDSWYPEIELINDSPTLQSNIKAAWFPVDQMDEKGSEPTAYLKMSDVIFATLNVSIFE